MNPERKWQGVKKARRIVRIWRQMYSAPDCKPELYADNGGLVQHMTDTRVPCSCPMCGNPRRIYGERTIQERKADDAMQVQLQEQGLA